MPARKDSSLSKRHDSKEDREARKAAEASIKPKTAISIKPPAALKGHSVASTVWNKLMSLYAETDAEIITAFDEDLLVNYCMAEEELIELYDLRAEVKLMWIVHQKLTAKIKPKPDELKSYFGALAQANALLQRFKDLDARLDQKRKMIFAMAQSLYLTPRSRAGVAPPEKPEEEPDSDMDKLLNG